MSIIQLSTDYSQSVAHMLVEYYENYNTKLGFDMYKTSYDDILANVSKMIGGKDTNIRYVGIVDDDHSLLGFVNYFLDRSSNFEVWIAIVDKLDEQQKKELMNHCIADFKKGGYKRFTIELGDFEDDLIDIVEDLGAKKVSNNYVIKG